MSPERNINGASSQYATALHTTHLELYEYDANTLSLENLTGGTLKNLRLGNLSATSISAPVGRTAAYTVAASDSSALDQAQADVVCGSTNADATILTALNLGYLSYYFPQGHYNFNTSIDSASFTHDMSGCTLRGAGKGTVWQPTSGISGNFATIQLDNAGGGDTNITFDNINFTGDCTLPELQWVSGHSYVIGNSILDGTFTFIVTSANATTGATYTNNGATFTVAGTIAGATTLVASSVAFAAFPTGSGTLVKSGGFGDANITFSSYTYNGNFFYCIAAIASDSVAPHLDATHWASPACQGISLYMVNDTQVRNCYFISNWIAVPMNNAHRTSVTNCWSKNNIHAGHSCYQSNDCLIDNNTSYNDAADGAVASIEASYGSNRTIITNNHVLNAMAQGILSYGGVHLTIDNNTIVAAQTWGYPLLGLENGSSHCIVSNNHIYGNGTFSYAGMGIEMSTATYCKFIGNTVDNCARPCLIDNAQYCLIEGNTLTNAGADGVGYYDNIMLVNYTGQSLHNTVCNNNCYNGNRAGISMSGSSYTNIYGNTCTDTRSAGSKTQLYGILEYSGSDYNYIHDNDVNGNSNGPGQNIYNIYGVHDKIYNNSGFNPQGKISNPFSNPGTITNGSGTLSGGPTLNLLGNGSAQTITTTSSGTFTIVLPYNMTATATSGTTTVSGSPQTITNGSTLTTTGGVGNFTIQILSNASYPVGMFGGTASPVGGWYYNVCWGDIQLAGAFTISIYDAVGNAIATGVTSVAANAPITIPVGNIIVFTALVAVVVYAY
jgi:parallel beta-helix repeat protein